MDRSRQRQFQQVRQSRGISQTVSIATSSEFPVQNYRNKQACNNCINRILANYKQKQDRRQKRRHQRQEKKQMNQMNQFGDESRLIRQKQLKDVHQHNQRAINDHQLQCSRRKQQQQVFRDYAQQQEEKLQQQMKNCFKKDKQRNKKYRQELFEQIIQKQKAKQRQSDHQKQIVLNPVIQISKSTDQIQYAKYLKAQINQKKKMRDQLKQDEMQEERRILSMYETEAVSSKKNNPQIFQELKELEQKKKSNTLEMRRQQEKQRKLLAQQDAQTREHFIKQKMRVMEGYVEELTGQIKQKKKRQEQEKRYHTVEVNQFENEEILKNQQYKNCQECHQQYPTQFIGPIPELA